MGREERMLSLIIFLIVSLSIVNIIVYEYVFQWLRDLVIRKIPKSLFFSLLNCPVCLGFWVGTLVSFYPLFDFGIHFIDNAIICGLLTSFFAKIIFKNHI